MLIFHLKSDINPLSNIILYPYYYGKSEEEKEKLKNKYCEIVLHYSNYTQQICLARN